MAKLAFGSPAFRLWLADLKPILIAGAKAGVVAFLASVTAPAIGVTVTHWGWFTLVASFVGTASVALQRYLSDNTKGG